MLHDPDLTTRPRRPRPARRREADELGANDIALHMLAGLVFGLLLVELIGRLTGHPGVALLLGRAL